MCPIPGHCDHRDHHSHDLLDHLAAVFYSWDVGMSHWQLCILLKATEIFGHNDQRQQLTGSQIIFPKKTPDWNSWRERTHRFRLAIASAVFQTCMLGTCWSLGLRYCCCSQLSGETPCPNNSKHATHCTSLLQWNISGLSELSFFNLFLNVLLGGWRETECCT